MQWTILIMDYSMLTLDAATCSGEYVQFRDDTNAAQNEKFTESAEAEQKQQ